MDKTRKFLDMLFVETLLLVLLFYLFNRERAARVSSLVCASEPLTVTEVLGTVRRSSGGVVRGSSASPVLVFFFVILADRDCAKRDVLSLGIRKPSSKSLSLLLSLSGYSSPALLRFFGLE